MNDTHITKIATENNINPDQVAAVGCLLEQGATIPFIARYRKEATGSLDEVVITHIRDRLDQLADMDRRRTTIIKTLQQQGNLTDALNDQIVSAETLAELEDIYLPYKPKRRTRGQMAREKGLEPLAEAIFEQTGQEVQGLAEPFVDLQKQVTCATDALQGARDIMAEWINENRDARQQLRDLFAAKATIQSRAAQDDDARHKFSDYVDWQESLAHAPSHRILAMRRGEKENMLYLTIAPPADDAVSILNQLFVKGDGPDSEQVTQAVADCYKRLLSRSLETEMRLASKERADREAIAIFAQNLRQLLLAAPLGAKRTLAIDPGLRTGCKVACLDRQGKLLAHDTVYLHLSDARERQGADRLRELCREFKIEAIAIGNGTAGRETHAFVRQLNLAPAIPIVLVNESGASIYSASEAAREEFPDLDLTVRGAVSIGRRLMDPLSELVKIEAKSIGVGQYQHDVDQPLLKQALDDVVISCVNSVGVDVNRASRHLLTYVSGLGPQLAKNIVACRDENGPFKNRTALKKVKRLGPKAFEQCAGFLRIADGDNPLDASAVHPESYAVVAQMAKDLDCTVSDLMHKPALRDRIDLNHYVDDCIGLPSLQDILAELAKPGRDPRQSFEHIAFDPKINSIQDLTPGMYLAGVVTNITAFGAFVDIGVHQDGLVHISEMADRFVKDPTQVVRVQQRVNVTVLSVDTDRKRIGLSMKRTDPVAIDAATPRKRPAKKQTPAKPDRQPPKQPFNDAFAELAKYNKDS